MRLFPEEVAAQFRRDGWWSGRTWSDLLAEQRASQADRGSLIDPPNRFTFIHGEPRRWTWSEVGDQVDRLSRVLSDHDVRRDVVVGVQSPECVELPVVLLAVARLGAIVTPFPVQYRRHELAGMGSAAGLEVFVTTSHAVGRDMAADIAALTAESRHCGPCCPGPGLHRGRPVDRRRGHGLARPGGSPCRTGARLQRLGDPGPDVGHRRYAQGCAARQRRLGGAVSACSPAPRLARDDILLNPFPMVNGGGLAGMFLPWLTLGTTLAQHQPVDLDASTWLLPQRVGPQMAKRWSAPVTSSTPRRLAASVSCSTSWSPMTCSGRLARSEPASRAAHRSLPRGPSG